MVSVGPACACVRACVCVCVCVLHCSMYIIVIEARIAFCVARGLLFGYVGSKEGRLPG